MNSTPAAPQTVMGLNLVPDAGQWRRWWSLRWMAISGALNLTSEFLSAMMDPLRVGWSMIPGTWLSGLPTWLPMLFGISALVALTAAGLSRFIQQKVKPKP